MPAGRGEPGAVFPRREYVAADHSLPAFVIAVEEVDRQPVAPLDRLPGSGELGISRVAKRALPEADIADRDVEVAREPRELLGLPVCVFEPATASSRNRVTECPGPRLYLPVKILPRTM